jgi:hypothetical protein
METVQDKDQSLLNPEHRRFLEDELQKCISVEISGMMNQDMGKILIDAPVSSIIGVCQRASGNLASDAM